MAFKFKSLVVWLVVTVVLFVIYRYLIIRRIAAGYYDDPMSILLTDLAGMVLAVIIGFILAKFLLPNGRKSYG